MLRCAVDDARKASLEVKTDNLPSVSGDQLLDSPLMPWWVTVAFWRLPVDACNHFVNHRVLCYCCRLYECVESGAVVFWLAGTLIGGIVWLPGTLIGRRPSSSLRRLPPRFASRYACLTPAQYASMTSPGRCTIKSSVDSCTSCHAA